VRADWPVNGGKLTKQCADVVHCHTIVSVQIFPRAGALAGSLGYNNANSALSRVMGIMGIIKSVLATRPRTLKEYLEFFVLAGLYFVAASSALGPRLIFALLGMVVGVCAWILSRTAQTKS